MQALLKVFWDIALWRRGPRDLPPSPGLLLVTALLFAATSAESARLVDGPEFAIARGVGDLGFTAGVIWLCLAVARRRHRLAQTLIAMLGTGTLLAVPMMAVLLVAEALGANGPIGSAVQLLLLLLLQVWALCVVVHIVRVALEAPLVVGIAVSTSYFVVGYLFVERLVPAMVG
ncbi:MAG TPA: hypothetical protein VMU00_01435 [Steroidobacteraceae bacterium]|nr:hypothetical protein [Steroidobacteraceae bacterium]